jgi:hypothetical protein
MIPSLAPAQQHQGPTEELATVPASFFAQLVTVPAGDLEHVVKVSIPADQIQQVQQHLAAAALNSTQQDQQQPPIEERATLTLRDLLEFRTVGAVFTDVRHVSGQHAKA